MSREYQSSAFVNETATRQYAIGLMSPAGGAFINETIAAVTGQFARPGSDVADGPWFASTGLDLYAMLDETSASDTDYIWTATANAPFKIRFTTVTNPTTGTRYLRFRAFSPYAGRLRLGLYESTTLVEEFSQLLTTGYATYTVNPTQAVSNWAALDLWGVAF